MLFLVLYNRLHDRLHLYSNYTLFMHVHVPPGLSVGHVGAG